MRVKDVMTTDIGCCTADTTIQEVAQLMVDCDCGCIPIVENKSSMKLIGLVTDRDICCRCVAKGMDPRTTTVEQVMSTQIATVRAQDPLDEIERIMSDHQVRRIPVIDDARSCLGMVAMADLAMAASKQESGEVLREVSKPYAA